ncbi:MAG: hypothetical protein M1480_17330 [Bacteroidetes bacterium]|nr:hypothetical protein [Bacteroidota bacterium]
MNYFYISRNIFNLIIIIIQIQFVIPSNEIFATTYYIDATNGNDNNSGLSPSSAWQSINKVNNFSFASGDVIAFNRGQTFTGYTLTPPPTPSGTNNCYLTFTSYGTGNFPVIDGQGTRPAASFLNLDYLKFNKIKFYNGDSDTPFNSYGSHYMEIDSCIFDAGFSHTAAYIGHAFYLILRNNVFENGTDTQHGLYLGGGGHQLIEYNKFINNDGDGIHTNVNVDTHTRIIHPIIRYNWFENNSQSYQDQASDSAEIYGNVIINKLNGWGPAMAISYESGYNDLAAANGMIYNNTIIVHNVNASSNTGIYFYGIPQIDGWIVKNNIIYLADASGGYFIYQQSGGGTNLTFDNNLYYNSSGTPQWYLRGTSYISFSNWQSAGYDANGKYADPLFSNFSNNDFELTTGSPAINEGQNVVGLTRDILSNPIIGNPDAGTYEYEGQNSSSIKLNASVILAGCYANGTMSTNLLSRGFLPQNQPYITAPWNYNGSESLTNLPSSTVDWILIELRSDSSASTMIARRTALLKSNGSIVDLDGTSPVLFNNVPPGDYYIVIYHRNHLSVMSANKVTFTSNITYYNFTDSQLKAYGTNPMENLGNGLFGLYPGDGNADGIISQSDITSVWLPQFLTGIDGYQYADFNLDGAVTASDNHIYWLLDEGLSSQVPK